MIGEVTLEDREAPQIIAAGSTLRPNRRSDWAETLGAMADDGAERRGIRPLPTQSAGAGWNSWDASAVRTSQHWVRRCVILPRRGC